MFRQATRSRIITNAHCINQGQQPELTVPDGSALYFVEAAEPEDAFGQLLAVVRDRVPAR